MAIQISDLTATPNTTFLPGSIALNFTVTAEVGTPVQITYKIRNHVDVAFWKDEMPTQDIIQFVTLTSKSQHIHENVTLVMTDLHLDFSQMPIEVIVLNTIIRTRDTASCQISFRTRDEIIEHEINRDEFF